MIGIPILLAIGSTAPTMCQQHIGTIVKPVPIDSVINAASKQNPIKDEYETTAQFERRQQSARSAIQGSYIISVPFQSDGAKYDADSQVLRVYSDAIGIGFSPEYPSEVYQLIGSSLHNLDIVAERSEILLGKYAAQNAYGAKAVVKRLKRVTKVIFERSGGWYEDFFGEGERGQFGKKVVPIIDIPVTPNRARALKPLLRAAVVISPIEPFYATGKIIHRAPRLGQPNDWEDDTIRVVVANVQCALVIDPSGSVLGSAVTK